MDLLTAILIKRHTHLKGTCFINQRKGVAVIIPHPLEGFVAALGAELLVHQWRSLEAAVTPQDPGLSLPVEN